MVAPRRCPAWARVGSPRSAPRRSAPANEAPAQDTSRKRDSTHTVLFRSAPDRSTSSVRKPSRFCPLRSIPLHWAMVYPIPRSDVSAAPVIRHPVKEVSVSSAPCLRVLARSARSNPASVQSVCANTAPAAPPPVNTQGGVQGVGQRLTQIGTGQIHVGDLRHREVDTHRKQLRANTPQTDQARSLSARNRSTLCSRLLRSRPLSSSTRPIR